MERVDRPSKSQEVVTCPISLFTECLVGHVFLCSKVEAGFQLTTTHFSKIAAFMVSWKTMGFLDCVQVSVRMLPVRLARCDLEAPGWGEPWFPHCAFVASWLTDYCMAFLWCCLFALVFLCHTNPLGDTMLSSLLVRFRCL